MLFDIQIHAGLVPHPAADAPDFQLVLSLICSQAQGATVGVPPLPSLTGQPQSDALEVLLHISLLTGGQRSPLTVTLLLLLLLHVPIKDLRFSVDNGKHFEEGGFGG